MQFTMLRAQNIAAVPIDEVPKLLITDASDLEYLTEGAANVLYRYVGKEDKFQTHLIRLRKHLPNFPTTQQLYTHLHKVFVPLLPSSILETKLVEISPAVLKDLNRRLEENDRISVYQDGTLPKFSGKKKGRLDENERWGLIVEDMTPGVYQKYNLVNYALQESKRNHSKDLYNFSQIKDALQTNPDDNAVFAENMDARSLSKAGWRDLLTVEFKPKYLVQSPDAPSNWKLCRTCALRSMRSRSLSARSTASARSEASEGQDMAPPEYCPLDLVSGNPDRVRRAVEAIINKDDGVMVVDEGEVLVTDTALGEDGISPWLDILDTSIVDLLTSYFSDPACVTHVLADLQSHFGGKYGVLAPPTPSLEISAEEFSRMLAGHPTTAKIGEDICTAMSLRDCTVYVRIWVKAKEDGSSGIDVHVESKVGDLDMKTGEGGKGVYWRDVERRLIRGDWYTGRGMLEGLGCRDEPEHEEEDEYTDYRLTHAASEPAELLRNGSSDNFQLSSDFLKVPKVSNGSVLSTSTAIS